MGRGHAFRSFPVNIPRRRSLTRTPHAEAGILSSRQRGQSVRRPVSILVEAALLVILLGFAALLTTDTVPFDRARADIQQAAQLFADLLPRRVHWSPYHVELLAWATVAALWVVYGVLSWRTRHRVNLDLRLIAGVALLLTFCAVLVPPVYSADVFNYAIFGRVASHYGENPYAATPMDVAPRDAVMTYVNWPDIRSPYGPLWTAISELVTAGEASPLALALRFKLLGALAVLVDGFLVFRIARAVNPERAAWTYMTFAWNPLLLVEGVVGAHNEALILLFVLAGAWLAAESRSNLAAACVTASALIKYSTLPLLAITAFPHIRRAPLARTPWMAVELVLVVGAVTIGAFVPYWAGWDSLLSTAQEPARGMNNPLWGAIGLAGQLATIGAVTIGANIASIAGLALFSAWHLLIARREWARAPFWTLEDILIRSAQSLFLFLACWPRLQPWYFVVPLGLAIAAGPRHSRLVLAILSLALVSYAMPSF